MTTTGTAALRFLARAPAAALLALAACATPFSRLPQPPDTWQDRDKVQHATTEEGQHVFELKDFVDVVEKQETDVSCWAACATMVHRWDGEPASQADIIKRIQEHSDGTPEATKAASKHEVLLALAPDHKEELEALWSQSGENLGQALGEASVAQTKEERELAQQRATYEAIKAMLAYIADQTATMDLDSVLADLQDGQPVVVGLRETAEDGTVYGHAVVLCGVTAVYAKPDGALAGLASVGNVLVGNADGTGYGFKTESGYSYVRVKLIDPDPHKPNVREMDVAELKERADFFASRPFAQRMIEQELATLALAPPATLPPVATQP